MEGLFGLPIDGDLKRRLDEMVQGIMDKRMKFEPHCPIPEDVLKEWNEMNREMHYAASLTKAAEAKRVLFWHNLEKRLGIFERNIRLDTDNNMILLEVEGGEKGNDQEQSLPEDE